MSDRFLLCSGGSLGRVSHQVTMAQWIVARRCAKCEAPVIHDTGAPWLEEPVEATDGSGRQLKKPVVIAVPSGWASNGCLIDVRAHRASAQRLDGVTVVRGLCRGDGKTPGTWCPVPRRETNEWLRGWQDGASMGLPPQDPSREYRAGRAAGRAAFMKVRLAGSESEQRWTWLAGWRAGAARSPAVGPIAWQEEAWRRGVAEGSAAHEAAEMEHLAIAAGLVSLLSPLPLGG